MAESEGEMALLRLAPNSALILIQTQEVPANQHEKHLYDVRFQESEIRLSGCLEFDDRVLRRAETWTVLKHQGRVEEYG